MTATTLNQIRSNVFSSKPFIHAITNPISINQCANAVLALGAQPIMAEHPEEVCEITKTASALLLNTGNITDARMKSMLISAETAHEKAIPFVVDAVGVACSAFRRKYVMNLIENFSPSIIKGNYSEITALHNPTFKSVGVDAAAGLTVSESEYAAVHLAQKYKTVVLASGKVDIVTDGKKVVRISNGTHQLSRITGTGCMLGVLCATYLSAATALDAAVCACAVLGICGELSATTKGNGGFFLHLLDNLSTLTDADFEKYLKKEETFFEKH